MLANQNLTSLSLPKPRTAPIYIPPSYAPTPPPYQQPHVAYATTAVPAYILAPLTQYQQPPVYQQRRGNEEEDEGTAEGGGGKGARRSITYAPQPPTQVYYQGGVSPHGQGTQE